MSCAQFSCRVMFSRSCHSCTWLVTSCYLPAMGWKLKHIYFVASFCTIFPPGTGGSSLFEWKGKSRQSMRGKKRTRKLTKTCVKYAFSFKRARAQGSLCRHRTLQEAFPATPKPFARPRPNPHGTLASTAFPGAPPGRAHHETQNPAVPCRKACKFPNGRQRGSQKIFLLLRFRAPGAHPPQHRQKAGIPPHHAKNNTPISVLAPPPMSVTSRNYGFLRTF